METQKNIKLNIKKDGEFLGVITRNNKNLAYVGKDSKKINCILDKANEDGLKTYKSFVENNIYTTRVIPISISSPDFLRSLIIFFTNFGYEAELDDQDLLKELEMLLNETGDKEFVTNFTTKIKNMTNLERTLILNFLKP